MIKEITRRWAKADKDGKICVFIAFGFLPFFYCARFQGVPNKVVFALCGLSALCFLVVASIVMFDTSKEEE